MTGDPALVPVVGRALVVTELWEKLFVQNEAINADADLRTQADHILTCLYDFVEAAREQPEDRNPHKSKPEAGYEAGLQVPWELRGRQTIDAKEAAANIFAVIGEVILGANITITRNAGQEVRLVPVGPIKRFDVEEVRRSTALLEPHDRPSYAFVREMRARDRF